MDRITDFVRLFGKGTQGKQLLEVYKGYKTYTEAWETPVGKEIMGGLMSQLRSLAEKIEGGGDNILYLRGEYMVLKKYADGVADKLLTFRKMQERVKNKLSKG